MLPSFLTSTCSIAPGCSCSYRRTGSPVARSTCDSRFSRQRIRTRCAVEGATPVSAASWTGPKRLRSRNDTIRLVVDELVLAGIDRGRLERSVIGSPAAYRTAQRLTVGQEHWNRAATSAIGTPCSTTSWATRSRAFGVRAALAWDTRASCFGEVNLQQFHSTAGGPPMSPRHNDESHSLNQPVRSVQLGAGKPFSPARTEDS